MSNLEKDKVLAEIARKAKENLERVVREAIKGPDSETRSSGIAENLDAEQFRVDIDYNGTRSE